VKIIKLHKATKEHKCDLCKAKILKGSKYYRSTEKDIEGYLIWDWKEHMTCEVEIAVDGRKTL